MYILINMDKMQFVAKHPNFAVLSELGIIVCSESQEVIPLETWAFDKFTDLEVQQLYINLTKNNNGAIYTRDVINKVLVDYCHQIPESELKQFEVSKQCQYVLDNDLQGKCEYVLGALRPIEVEDQAFKYINADQGREEQLRLNLAHVVAVQATQEPYSVSNESQQHNPNQPTERATGSRTAGAKELIWQTADEMWEFAGKPTDKTSILLLRRDIMNVLESKGVKRTTSSTELGKWHITRAPY